MEFFKAALLALILLSSAFLLVRLWVIDMRERLLLDIYTAPLAVLGVIFHLLTGFAYEDWTGMALGAAVGGGILLFIRTIANWHYKQDTLGLGDVKLMAAAGLWLGLEYNIGALIMGALAGLVHGVIEAFLIRRKSGKWPDMGRLEIPAGPGFIVGIVIVAIVKFASLPYILLS